MPWHRGKAVEKKLGFERLTFAIPQVKSGEYLSLALSAKSREVPLYESTVTGKLPTYAWDLCTVCWAWACDGRLVSDPLCIFNFTAVHD